MTYKTKFLTKYFIFISCLAHIFVLLILITTPSVLGKLTTKIYSYYYQKQSAYDFKALTGSGVVDVEGEILKAFKPWDPLPNYLGKTQSIAVNGTFYHTIKEAMKVLKDGDEIQFNQGVYNEAFLIDKDDITIVGYGHVVFEKSAYRGKGFIVNTGDNLTIKNIECRYISVPDENGACIRQEGSGLTLEHVYFHHSENGVLETHKKSNSIFIKDSRFERLGKKGQAHGIYSNRANLYIDNTLFIATKDEGHAIKNRGNITFINKSLIVSMSSDDSRLIDIPNGGELVIQKSLLQQGPLSENGQVIGFGLEGVTNKKNKIRITDNILMLERIKQNVLVKTSDKQTPITLTGNLIIADDMNSEFFGNITFLNRKEANFPDYPFFPIEYCQYIKPCPFIAVER